LEEEMKKRQALERRVMVERSLRIKIEEELAMMRNKVEGDYRGLRSKIEEEFRKNFSERQ
jgi:hypothetical protein